MSDITIIEPAVTLNNSETYQFTCMATYSDQSTQDVTDQATWSVSPGTAGEMDAATKGLFKAHAVNTGAETVRASYMGLSDEVGVTVQSQPGGSTMTGNDGQVYQTIIIGNQEWMAENLRETKYRDGSTIPVETNNTTWLNLTSGARCAYNNNETNAVTYGYLYNWYAVTDSRDIAPMGWHISTDEEWKTLEKYLGMSQSNADAINWRGNEGGKLKEIGTTYWDSPNSDATNESGFTALPGGVRHYNGDFGNLGYYATFWSFSEYSNFSTCRRILNCLNSNINRDSFDKRYGCSVRLVRD